MYFLFNLAKPGKVSHSMAAIPDKQKTSRTAERMESTEELPSANPRYSAVLAYFCLVLHLLLNYSFCHH
jgi:hypothetical protein